MTALFKHSHTKRNKPNSSGWQSPFPAQPRPVAETELECPHNVCGGGLARELRRNGKDKLVVCTIKCTRIPQLASSPSPSFVREYKPWVLRYFCACRAFDPSLRRAHCCARMVSSLFAHGEFVICREVGRKVHRTCCNRLLGLSFLFVSGEKIPDAPPA